MASCMMFQVMFPHTPSLNVLYPSFNRGVLLHLVRHPRLHLLYIGFPDPSLIEAIISTSLNPYSQHKLLSDTEYELNKYFLIGWIISLMASVGLKSHQGRNNILIIFVSSQHLAQQMNIHRALSKFSIWKCLAECQQDFKDQYYCMCFLKCLIPRHHGEWTGSQRKIKLSFHFISHFIFQPPP